MVIIPIWADHRRKWLSEKQVSAATYNMGNFLLNYIRPSIVLAGHKLLMGTLGGWGLSRWGND